MKERVNLFDLEFHCSKTVPHITVCLTKSVRVCAKGTMNMLVHALCQSKSTLKEVLSIYVYSMQAVFNEIFSWTKETDLPGSNKMICWKV